MIRSTITRETCNDFNKSDTSQLEFENSPQKCFRGISIKKVGKLQFLTNFVKNIPQSSVEVGSSRVPQNARNNSQQTGKIEISPVRHVQMAFVAGFRNRNFQNNYKESHIKPEIQISKFTP